MSPRPRDPFFWGLLLIVLGGLVLLRNLNLLNGQVFAWWPALVLAAGGWLLARGLGRRHGGGLVGGVLLLGLGGYWLAFNLGFIGDNFFVPVVLVALGVGLLLRAFARPHRGPRREA